MTCLKLCTNVRLCGTNNLDTVCVFNINIDQKSQAFYTNLYNGVITHGTQIWGIQGPPLPYNKSE